MADDGYDPRFDPAFQRGFEGETSYPPRQVATPAPSRHDARPAPERMIAPIPDELRVRPRTDQSRTDQSRMEQPRGEQSLTDLRQRTLADEYGHPATRSPFVAEPRAELPPPPLRSNPFLIAVLVIAVALIGFGVLIGSRIDLWYNDVSADGPGFGLLNMLQFGGPLAIMLGLAAVIAVLIILALRWRGRAED